MYYSSDLQNTVYWEKQEDDLLCAVHAVNSLMQNPIFDAVDFGTIAQNLDKEESSLYRTDPSKSHNVEESGFYSIQVISMALKTYKLSIRYFTLNKDPLQEEAFICNYQAHWFTIRKINNIWFNLNSLYPIPQIVSETYLSMLLNEYLSKNYSIFVINGDLPKYNHGGLLQKHQRLVPIEQIRNTRLVIKDSEDDELKKAIELSKKLNSPGAEYQNYSYNQNFSSFEDEELKKAIELSNKVNSPGFEHQDYSHNQDFTSFEDEDKAVKMAIEMSLKESQPAGSQVEPYLNLNTSTDRYIHIDLNNPESQLEFARLISMYPDQYEIVDPDLEYAKNLSLNQFK